MNTSSLLAPLAAERRRDLQAQACDGRLARLATCCRPAALSTALRALARRVRPTAAACCA